MMLTCGVVLALYVILTVDDVGVCGFQFYMEVNEVELWMNEKIPQLTSPDLGKDEDSVLVSGTMYSLIVHHHRVHHHTVLVSCAVYSMIVYHHRVHHHTVGEWCCVQHDCTSPQSTSPHSVGEWCCVQHDCTSPQSTSPHCW